MSELKLKTTQEVREWMRGWASCNLPIGSPYFPYAIDDFDTCLAEIERLRGVLSWYAFTGNDLTEQTSDDIWDNTYMLAHQLYLYGQRAREALK